MKNCLFGTLLIAALSRGALAGTVNFSTFVSSSNITAVEGQTNTIGFTYAGNKFVGSVYFGASNDQLYQTDLTGNNVQKFGSPLPSSATGEVTVAAALGLGGFTGGDVYAGSEAQGTIYRYANSGGAPSVFATGLTGGVKSILFDPGSSFGGKMLVSTSTGSLYSINSAGTPTLLTNLATTIEGMDILTSNWGTLAGDIALVSETASTLYLIDKTTFAIVGSLPGIPLAETASLVPLNLGLSGNPLEGFYDANYPVNIQKAGAAQFAGMQGDIIATSEQGSNASVWDVKYSGNPATPFSGGATLVGNLPNQSEDGIFVTAERIDLLAPEPSNMILPITVVLGIGLLFRRKLRGPRAA